MPGLRSFLIWVALCAALTLPIAIAAQSPLLAYRQPVYIAAGFAGVIAMASLLLQPLMAGGMMPGLSAALSRKFHRWIGVALVFAVTVHVGALWITSPPDVVDALTFTSPTPFSLWGVIAMWGVFAAAVLASQRRRLRPVVWRRIHAVLGVIVVAGSVLHAVLIEGTMGTLSKYVLCGLVLAATVKVMIDRRIFARKASDRSRQSGA